VPSPPQLRPVPDPEPAARRLTWRFAAKLAATLALLALAGLALARPGALERERGALLEEARAAGVAGDALGKLSQSLRREADPAAMRLEAARVLLNREIGRPAPWAVGETRARLGRVRELAGQVLAEQPASWQALTIHASALTLMRTRTADTRLFTRFEEWERPLELAAELGPSYRFPKETLAFVYLEVWPAIAPSKRPQVEAILREAFEEERIYLGLVGKWLRIAGSLDEAARLVPDTPWAWAAFVEAARQARDWPAFVRFGERRRRSLDAAIDRELERAEGLAAAGQHGAAVAAFDQALVGLAPERRHAARLERLLARRPPAPGGRKTAQAAAAWLAWQRPLALLGLPSISPEATGRLVLLAADLLDPAESAMATLVAGDLARAEVHERRNEALWSERWAPYLTLKARRALEAGDAATARVELERAHRSIRGTVAWASLARAVAFAPERAAGAPHTPTPRDRWEPTDWLWQDGAARLELWPERDASALDLELEKGPRGGAILVPYWDGAALEPLPLAAGQTTIRIPVEVTPEPHLLELRRHAGDLRPTARVALR